MQRRLIEHNISLAEISDASSQEKNIRHGHPSTLHIWWPRRPLVASRATAFAALIDDPGEDHPQEREYLQDLIKRMVPWEAIKDGNNEAIIETRELIKAVRKNVSIDWTVKQNARARTRVLVKRILRKYGYPPDLQEAATKTVLEQAELLAAEWA